MTARLRLHPGEQVLLDSRLHGGRLIGPVLFSAVVLAGCGVGEVMWPSAPTWCRLVLGGVGALAVLSTLARVLAFRTRRLIISSTRLILRSGWLRRSTYEVPIDSVVRVSSHQRLFERLIRRGVVIVELSGDTSRVELSEV